MKPFVGKYVPETLDADLAVARATAIREFNAKVPPKRPEMAVTPGSPLFGLLNKMKRPERRMLLGFLQAGKTPRKTRAEKELHRRLRQQGIE